MTAELIGEPRPHRKDQAAAQSVDRSQGRKKAAAAAAASRS